MPEPAKKFITPEEYFALQEQAEYKNEYVERFAKTDQGTWVLSEWNDAAATLKLESLDFSIAIAEIYRGVSFSE